MDRDTVSVVVSCVLLLITTVGFATTFLAFLLLSKETTKIPEIINRLVNTEMLLGQLAQDVGMEINEREANVQWKTADGKYQASSFEELLHFMASDPNGPLTGEEIDAIKSVFDKIAQNDSDDEDGPNEPWRKK